MNTQVGNKKFKGENKTVSLVAMCIHINIKTIKTSGH